LIRIAIATLGCKVNQAESAALLAQFADSQVVDWAEEADIYIINTCTVTNRTDYKSRYLIRQALEKKKANPFARVVVTGCFAQRSRDEILALGAVDYVVDNQQKLEIASILAGSPYSFMDIMQAASFAYRPYTQMYERTRAFMKVQDGCDFYCSYCAVPYGRGHSRSASLNQVLRQARLLVESGYKEIVLGGVNLGLYRDGGNGLAEVARELAKLEGLQLLRLSSLEPQLISDQLISQLSAIPKLCPHFHIPLQSGSDSVLKRMGRRYDTRLVEQLCAKLATAFPFVALGLDVITGFPGETGEEHRQTIGFLQSLPLAYLHVFSYSKRKGTPAEKMPNQVLRELKNKRSGELHALSGQLSQVYRNTLAQNKVLLRGIVESSEAGFGEFVSDHYLRYRVAGAYQVGELVEITASPE